MITCTNCGYSNPEGAITCEACYVELPNMATCTSCQSQVPEDAVFCSQCGTSLQPGAETNVDMATAPTQVSAGTSTPTPEMVNFDSPSGIPVTEMGVPLPRSAASAASGDREKTEFLDLDLGSELTELPLLASPPPSILTEMSEQSTNNIMQPPPFRSSLPTPPEIPELDEPTPPRSSDLSQPSIPKNESPPDLSQSLMPPIAEAEFPPSPAFEKVSLPAESMEPAPPPLSSEPRPNPSSTSIPTGATQLQLSVASLLHERTNTMLNLPTNLHLVHIGKPNDRIPPDVDVSGFPNSDVVSRVHADIRIDPEGYYLEDKGSANGTYVNNQPLRPGDRYRLRAGDRISLGKEDKVSFIFHPG